MGSPATEQSLSLKLVGCTCDNNHSYTSVRKFENSEEKILENGFCTVQRIVQTVQFFQHCTADTSDKEKNRKDARGDPRVDEDETLDGELEELVGPSDSKLKDPLNVAATQRGNQY